MNSDKAIIIGGTKGLGLSLASEAKQHGIGCVLYGRSDPNHLQKHQNYQYNYLDLTDSDHISSMDLIDPKVKYFYWVAGEFLQQSLTDTADNCVEDMTKLHLTNPYRILRNFHQNRKDPYHLITIGSTSTWKSRKNETLYSGLKSAQATITRNFTHELIKDLPGSKVTLVQPGGMRTPNFWRKFNFSIENFMSPDEVAKIIWAKVISQSNSFDELHLLRSKKEGNESSKIIIEHGQKTPENPNDIFF